MHQCYADLIHRCLWLSTGDGLGRSSGIDRPGEHGEHGYRDQRARHAKRGRAIGFVRLRAARHHDGKRCQDRDRADVDEDLGESYELSAELQIQRGQSDQA